MKITIQQAINLFALSEKEAAKLDVDKDGNISKEEALKCPNNIPLIEHFYGKGSGKLAAAGKLNPTTAKCATNTFENLKNTFAMNYNEGQLSPRVDSDLAQSSVGNKLSRLYA
jgi:hypothetical protein